jgi:hypothetical protein
VPLAVCRPFRSFESLNLEQVQLIISPQKDVDFVNLFQGNEALRLTNAKRTDQRIWRPDKGRFYPALMLSWRVEYQSLRKLLKDLQIATRAIPALNPRGFADSANDHIRLINAVTVLRYLRRVRPDVHVHQGDAGAR